MSFDALDALRSAGHAVDVLSTDQRKVLAELTPTEVEVLNSVKERLDAVEPEVRGQEVKML